MRRTLPKQGRLFTTVVDDELAEELNEVNALIGLHPEWVEWVMADLTGGNKARRRRGREGMAPDLVLRLQFLKHRHNVPLRNLARLVNNTLGFRQFLGLGLEDKAPKRSTMQENLAKVRAETWGRILHSLLQSRELREFETGEKVRIDATVVASNIHRPSDSSLLWDSVRVLTRLMKQARSLFAEVEFEDRSKQAKKLHSRIFWARKKEQRQPAYEALIAEARGVGEQAKLVEDALKRVVPQTLMEIAMCKALAADLRRYRSLMARVVDQTERRVLRGEKVPAQEKLFRSSKSTPT